MEDLNIDILDEDDWGDPFSEVIEKIRKAVCAEDRILKELKQCGFDSDYIREHRSEFVIWVQHHGDLVGETLTQKIFHREGIELRLLFIVRSRTCFTDPNFISIQTEVEHHGECLEMGQMREVLYFSRGIFSRKRKSNSK